MKGGLTLFLLLVGAVSSLRGDTSLVFNEVMYHPATNEPAMEWVELYNQLAVDLDISGWSLAGGIQYTFASNTIVHGGNYLVVAVSPSTLISATGLTNVFGPFIGRLANSGETVQIKNNSGRVVDGLTYGTDGAWPVAPDGAGVSLAKRDPETASGPPENWRVSDQIGGTPGAVNFRTNSGFVAPNGLISYWNFNEASGVSAADQAGQNTGLLGSGVSHATAIGGALLFNGTSNAFVNTGPGFGNNFSVTAGVTVEAALLPGWSSTNSAVIFRKGPRKPGSYQATVLASLPLAYWRLGEGTTTILDSTANAHNGTASAGVLLNQPSLVPTDPANGAVRASSSARITIPGFEKIGPGGYTVEYWLKVNQLPGGCCQNLIGDGESTFDFFLMNYIAGPGSGVTGAIRQHFSLNNSPVSYDSPTTLQVNRAYHIATTWSATNSVNNAAIYINGVLDHIGSTSLYVPPPGAEGNNIIYIGPDNRSPGDGDYTYDEVAIYNFPLSATDVAAHYTAGTLTNFDANQGNNIQLAFQNDGNNSQAVPPVPAGPVLSFGLTVAGTYSELDMPLDGQNGRPTLAALENGQVHHVAATYDSSSGLKAIYVDGVLRFSTTLSGSINDNNSANAILGNSESNGVAPFVGTLDEMAFWSRALSGSEVAAHFSALQAGRDYFAPASGAAATTLSFNELSPATNTTFWLELANYGTSNVPLAGYVIVLDGVTNAEFVFPSGPSIAAGGFWAVTNTTLGFHPVAGDKLYLLTPARDKILDAVSINAGAAGRFPDATGSWLFPTTPTPGASNIFQFHSEVVLNEIMYNHHSVPSTNGLPPQKSDEAWVELFNRSSNAVNLTGWQLGGGISYNFPAGKTISAGGYLVVAKDAAALHTSYPAVDIVGDFNHKLSGSGDTVTLIDPAGNPANSVHYFNDGRWPSYAAGGGSSLELRDPYADNSRPEAWAASDETHKSSWQTFTYRAVAQTLVGPEQWNDFVLGLLSEGECLVDDISVVQSPTNSPVQFIANGNFENGQTGWRILGNHNRSRVETDPDNAGNHVLHVVATGPQEHMHNHIETTYTGGHTVANGQLYEISFRARWLAGNNLLNTRLYFDRVAKTTALPVPMLNGTPGARNSSYATNIGPTFSQFHHSPVIPAANAPVTVSVVAQDSQSASSCEVWWSPNGAAFFHAAMSAQGGGLYAGTIPGYPAGYRVQFYVRATDGLGAVSTYPAAGTNSGAFYAVTDGQAALNLGHNLRILLSPANQALMYATTNLMSNDNLPCTVIYDEKRPYYDMQLRLKGSERGRIDDARQSFHLQFQPDDLFRGVHPVMLIDRSAPLTPSVPEIEVMVMHIALRAGGIPEPQPDICHVIAPVSSETGPAIITSRFEDDFIATAYENGSSGIEWEMELDYFPTTTNASGYKLPSPDDVRGVDISDLGSDKETYRYNFIIKNHRDDDDYSRFISLGKAFSLPTGSGSNLEADTRQLIDIDEWLRVFALYSLCGMWDNYTYDNDHNVMFYLRPSDQKILAFPWDMDVCFYRSASSPLIGDRNWGKIENLPANRRRFYAHVLDLINSSYNTAYMTYWANHYVTFATGQNYSGALSYISQRTSAALNEINSAGGNAAFSVNGPNPITTSSNLLTLTGTAPVQAATIRINGIEYPITWTSVSTWTLLIPLSSPSNSFTITAYDVHGNPLTNLTSTITVNYTGAVPNPVGAIVFNEIMYQPAVSNAAYVELFNSSTQSFDLSNWELHGAGYTFPPGSIITNGQFLVLAKDSAAYQLAYSSSPPAFDVFPGQLQTDGETLSLLRPGTGTNAATTVDRVRYSASPPWPSTPAGTALQLIDPAQDRFRPANWTVVQTNIPLAPQWVYVTANGTASSSTFYLYLQTAGDVFVDDIKFVAGNVPEAGPNLLADGDFESGFPGPWTVSANLAGSGLSTSNKHSGAASVHVVATSGGSTQGSAIWQTISPALTIGAPYTLSFWYFQSTNGGPLTLRLSGSGVAANVNPAPSGGFLQAIATPGATNSVQTNLPPFPTLWLNELQADNLTGITNSAGQHTAWLELYNPATNSISLQGLYLASAYTNLTAWVFPAGAVINPGQFKVIFADGQSNLSTLAELHTSFALPSGAGSLALSRLYNGQPQVLDNVDYAGLGPNRSYGSFPDGQIFDRQSFFYPTPAAPNNASSAPTTIFINEWMADNTITLSDPADGDFEDWFELYNPGTNAVDLGGYYLTDTLTNKFQFKIPSTGRYVVPPQGFLLVWADNETGQNNTNRPDLHTNFKLDKAGEAIGIFAPDGTVVDAITFGQQASDVSEGRFPDGSGSIFRMAVPTPRLPNQAPNTPPVLAAIDNVSMTLGQTLAFSASATDTDQPPQTLSFSLGLGAPPGASIGPATGHFVWTPANAPATNSLSIIVSDNGMPSLSATQSFSVKVYLPPRLGSVTFSAGEFSFSWQSAPGLTYQLEYADALSAGAWTSLGAPMPGTGDLLTFADTLPTAPQRFYRLRLLP